MNVKLNVAKLLTFANYYKHLTDHVTIENLLNMRRCTFEVCLSPHGSIT